MNTVLDNPIFYIFILNIACLISLGIYFYKTLKTVTEVINIQDREISELMHQVIIIRTIISAYDNENNKSTDKGE